MLKIRNDRVTAGQQPRSPYRRIALVLAVLGFFFAMLTSINAVEPELTIVILICALAAITGMLFVTTDPPEAILTNPTASEQLAVNWQQLQTVLKALPEPAFVLNHDDIVVDQNAAFEKLFGKRISGKSVEAASRDPEFLSAVAAANQTGQRRTVRIMLHQPEPTPLIVTVSPIQMASKGSHTAHLVSFQDVTEQLRISEMRSDFVANASHELRTPLASLRGFIETLQSSARHDEAARAKFLSIMAAQAERMTRLIDDLLLLSRVEERVHLAPTRNVDIVDILNDVTRTLAPIAAERKTRIEPLAYNGELLIAGDRDELFQVFQNLIENAIKYGDDNGLITLSVTPPATNGGNVKIHVVDDGPGIPPEHLPRLTERFYRVNANHSRRIGGTGLGLAIVKHILQRHNGRLSIESEIGIGTTAIVTLPTAP